MKGESERVLDASGAAAPPRSNGELVFEAPWQSRLFGLTMALFESGAFDWDEFRALLIEEIAAFEADAARGARDPAEWSYYACWQTAFERLLAQKGLCPDTELETRVRTLAARPHGHDHPPTR